MNSLKSPATMMLAKGSFFRMSFTKFCKRRLSKYDLQGVIYEHLQQQRQLDHYELQWGS